MEPAENSRIIKKEIFQAETLSPIKIRGEVNQVHTNYSCRGSGGVIIGVSILYSVLCSLNRIFWAPPCQPIPSFIRHSLAPERDLRDRTSPYIDQQTSTM